MDDAVKFLTDLKDLQDGWNLMMSYVDGQKPFDDLSEDQWNKLKLLSQSTSLCPPYTFAAIYTAYRIGREDGIECSTSGEEDL